MKFLSLIPSLALVALPAVALADDHQQHGHSHDHNHSHGDSGFYGHLHATILMDHVYKAAESDEEINEAYTHSHLEMGYVFGNGFSVNSNVMLEGEPAGHDHGGGGGGPDGSDRFFEDTPLYVRSLTVNYDSDHFGAYAGKFDPVISFDEHTMPGIYGYQVTHEYLVSEKIGLGGYARLNAGDFGTHRLDVSSFFADTTFLSNSVLYQRGVTHKSDGGVSNTEDFSSFAVSLGGSGFYSLKSDIPEGLSYRLGFARLAKGEGDEEAESRYTVSGQYRHVFTSDWSGRVLGEMVHIDHLHGEAPHDRTYSTLGMELSYRAWDFGTTYTHIRNDNPTDPDEDMNGEIYQASLSYNFANGFTVGAGYKYQEEEGEKNHRIGALIGYSISF
ncbi:MAG: hypothetical protein CMN55_11105 [Sneathiella sp.]|jgi:hypothetical protein|uniref:hypothetical protein n=1 Tax=Sneathiella sp. TaxID=1964365 RepID=UPI000C5EF710|nr:hypothetical protein [Sneathiella sp.]MAL79640.1 hypothetical protein [Sneathiella sp.]|tara:strand:- start:906 stop:2066 length:1161 start_codon:yes stop_codon:yes gene_type:complete